MKKFISFSVIVSVFLYAYPVTTHSADLVQIPAYTDDETFHISQTLITGDLNNDGEVSVSDLVIMTKFLLGKDYVSHEQNTDINLDGSYDIFDLITLRKYVISPESAYKHIKSIDILATANKTSKNTLFLKNTTELVTYLSSLGTNNDEIQKYLDIYDEDFFSANDLLLGAIEQKNGNGIHYNLPVCLSTANEEIKAVLNRIPVTSAAHYDHNDFITDNTYIMITNKNYSVNPLLYPEKTSILLFQATFPKSTKQYSALIDFNIFEPEYKLHFFDSPDKSRRICVSYDYFNFFDPEVNYYFYYVNNDGSYSYSSDDTEPEDLFSYYDYFSSHDPFDYEGYWAKDNNGYPVYTCKDEYSITWLKDRALIKFNVGNFDPEHIEQYENPYEWVVKTVFYP